MNAMLLAAGRGERMEPLSSVVAKPALEVLGEPLCATAVRQLARFGDTLVVNLHRHPRQVAAAVREVLGDRRVFFSWEPVLLGGAGGLARARRLFGPGPLLVGNGDTVSALDLAPLAAPADPECCTLGLLPHPDPRRWSSVELASDGRVRTIFPAGAADGGDLFLFTGFQVLGAEVLACLPSPPGELAPVWQRLRGPVGCEESCCAESGRRPVHPAGSSTSSSIVWARLAGVTPRRSSPRTRCSSTVRWDAGAAWDAAAG